MGTLYLQDEGSPGGWLPIAGEAVDNEGPGFCMWRLNRTAQVAPGLLAKISEPAQEPQAADAGSLAAA